MKKMITLLGCLILITSKITAATNSNIIIWPLPITSNAGTSIADIATSLKQQQQMLTAQLNTINTQLITVEAFLKAQAALGLTWVNAENGVVPANALKVPLNNNSAYICHATFMHGIHPGIINKAGCLITYGGYSLIEPSYQVLIGSAAVQWNATDSLQDYRSLQQNPDLWHEKYIPIQGGFENGAPLYICKTDYENKTYIGKVIMDNCNFAVGAKEIYVKNFQILFGATR